MSGRYLLDLADVLRAAGLTVDEYPGWEARARSSGGYASGRPWCVMWHHTASDTSPENDAAYCAEGDPDAPICNLLIDRADVVHVIAAGATNTNGKGYAMRFTRGTVPDDSMNTYAVGLEICSDGVGGPYPPAQIDAAFAVSLAVCAAYGLDPADVGTHQAWAFDRKIDPATAAAVGGPWHPDAVNSSGSWALDDLRAECARRAGSSVPNPGPPPDPYPPPTLEDDTVITAALEANGTLWIGDGIRRRAIADPGVFDRLILVHGARFVNTSQQPIRGWDDVGTADAQTLEALGTP